MSTKDVKFSIHNIKFFVEKMRLALSNLGSRCDSIEEECRILEKRIDEMAENSEDDFAPCGHPESYWKVEPNQEAWCIMCAVEKLAIENNQLRQLLEAANVSIVP